jgi:hypothetical protein
MDFFTWWLAHWLDLFKPFLSLGWLASDELAEPSRMCWIYAIDE